MVKSRRLGLYLLLAFTAVLLVSWTLATPVFEAPDESSHWQIARYIHDHGRLPHYGPAIVEGNQPPIYYTLIAPFARESAPPPPCSPRIYSVCSAYFARFAPVRRARLFTALLSVLTVLLVYMSGVEISGSRDAGILAGTLLICLPEFAFRGGNVSNDGMVATTSALATYWIIRLMRRGFSLGTGIIASLCVALAFLSKVNAIILVPVMAGVLISFAGDWKVKLKRLSVLLAAALCAGPWLIRNQILYGDPLASKVMLTAVPSLIDIKPLWSPWFLHVFPATMAKTLVGAFGSLGDVFLPRTVNLGFACLLLVAFAGLGYAIYRRKMEWRMILVLFALVALAIASAVQLNMTISQPQGRYMFAGLPALAVLTATGLQGLPGWNRFFHYATLGVLAGVSIYALFGIEVPRFWRFAPADTQKLTTYSFIASPYANALSPANVLRQGDTFGQTFVASGADLSSVEVVVPTYGKKLNSGLVKLHLRSSPGATQDIASVTVAATQITDNMLVALKFPPIRDSKGRSFYFFMETANMTARDAVTVWVSKGDVYRDGEFYANGKPTGQDMLIRVLDTTEVHACGDCSK